MKTYTDILYEVIESDFQNVTPITEGLRIRVAKAYAKQWVKRALEEASEVDLTLLIELEKEIDNQ